MTRGKLIYNLVSVVLVVALVMLISLFIKDYCIESLEMTPSQTNKVLLLMYIVSIATAIGGWGLELLKHRLVDRK
ncbi:hypothetical protein ACFO9Q_14060 [Paenibacillus sp. GCM10023252]|uniref:hypothetical protein n=1 Tax=Paenibacillus sp. GCM10023252 TaxID=3252649 RepID=UPI0036192115